ncbi:MAG: hypothetical protein L0H96_21225 [Humibacillus sp.]|nr:hypothetical protein [Humibacillus sp.]MDN5779420.1 hypothetical protein [Humibacillus sp.]
MFVVQHAVYVLHFDARICWEPIEPDLAVGIEFAYTRDGQEHVYQLKRQISGQASWSPKALASHEVWRTARHHLSRGRLYHFVSESPFAELVALTERTREADDLATFKVGLSKGLQGLFDKVKDEGFASDDETWQTLRGMFFEVHQENTVATSSEMHCAVLLDGSSGFQSALVIAEVMRQSLGKVVDADRLLGLLAKNQVRPLTTARRASTLELVAHQCERWMTALKRELLTPAIERTTTGELIAALGQHRLALITGSAGGGKSVVLVQAVDILRSSSPVLPLRLDQLDGYNSTAEIGQHLGLPGSPAEVLARAANGEPSYLIIDQLDAVSLISGRTPNNFDVVVALIDEALSTPGVHVVLACREFDIDNDYRLLGLRKRPDLTHIRVGALTDEMVDTAVQNMGLDASRLTTKQRELLHLPLHLVLLHSVASLPTALDFTSKPDLFQTFWDRKQQVALQRRSGLLFEEVVRRLATQISDRQSLSVPIEVMDEGGLGPHAKVLISEHLLTAVQGRLRFFHESFFDYAFARLWITRTETLVEYLTTSEQELFRRAQVRQVLTYLRERDADRFLDEVESLLLRAAIRFHIKETVLAVLAALEDLTPADVELILRVADTQPGWEDRMWQMLQTPAWFLQLHAGGWLASWLDSSDEALQVRAVNLMARVVRTCPKEVAALLRSRTGLPDYPKWLRYVLNFSATHEDRDLFDLLLDGVRNGLFDEANQELWLSVHELGANEPLWATELLRARLLEHPEGLTLGDNGKVTVLTLREYGAAELVKQASEAEPEVFVRAMLPYLRSVMVATAREERPGEQIGDEHFTWRYPLDDADERELDDALLLGVARGLMAMAQTAPGDIEDLLRELASDPYDSSQYLLYRALTAAVPVYADWSAELLLAGGARLECGYTSDNQWVTRELIAAIAPHVNDDIHQELEELVRDLQSEWESQHSRGARAFGLLSALDEARLTQEGRKRRGEYRRKFGKEQPSPLRGVMGGWIGSPIDQVAIEKMSDDQWLKAMTKYADDETNWDTLTGGARELAHMLKQQTTADPERFAKLSFKITSELNSAYGDAILMGLGEAEASDDRAGPVFDAVRHVASLGKVEHDRWLSNAIRPYTKQAPTDIVELILDRALHSADPADDRPIFQRSADDEHPARDLHMDGINTARGTLAESLGDLLINDEDGHRTALVAPHLVDLASDAVISVRTCVAHTIAASLLHDRDGAYRAFEKLIEGDDVILATNLVQRLMLFIGNGTGKDVVMPVIPRMLQSSSDEVREVGGSMAAVAAISWNRLDFLDAALAGDARVRAGVASICAHRLDSQVNPELASSTLIALMNDESDEVRQHVGEVAGALRDEALRPHAELLSALLLSKSYEHATPQLMITLQHAPDRIDELILETAQQFVQRFNKEMGDMRTSVAGDAHYISELVVRALAQTRDKTRRAALLDVMDTLIENGVYGVHKAMDASER